MPYTTLENTPITIDLVAQSVTTGWTASGNTAVHEACNTGYIDLIPPTGLTITAGQTYSITFKVNSITGSGSLYVQPFMGTTAGTQYSTTGFKTASLVAAGASPKARFLSNTDVVISIFTIQLVLPVTTAKQQNNIVYNEKTNKWSDFRTYQPDCGFGMFINLYTIKAGNLYLHQHASSSSNNFYGNQYTSIINLPFNKNVANSNTFESVSIQSNMLLITTTDGITTSLAQISELIAEDFTKATLTDGATSVVINTAEGVYSAAFLRDKNIDIINGDVLKGNWMTIELVTTAATSLRLFSVCIHSEKSSVGVR